MPIQRECYSAGVPLMAKSLINAKEGKCYNPLMHFYSNAQEILSNYVDNDPTDFERPRTADKEQFSLLFALQSG